MSDKPLDSRISGHEGLTIRALDYGGFLVTHPDIYNVKALYFASTTMEEAFSFIKQTFKALADKHTTNENSLTAGKRDE